jgi:glycerate 2-kinase
VVAIGTRAAELARAIYDESLVAVRADRLVRAALSVEDDVLRVAGQDVPLANIERILLVAVGKASGAMAQAAAGVLGDRIAGGVVIEKRHDAPEAPAALPPTLRRIHAGHPVPDADSVAAGTAALAVADSAGERDLVLCLLSGGASALMEAPRPGITLDDLRATTEALLRSGADIGELNTVRACLSCVKAGGLARAAAPARVVCLALSDVLGSPPAVIGSGPCTNTPVRPNVALDILARRDLIPRVPESVISVLHTNVASPDGPALVGPEALYHVIGDIWTAIDAARDAAIHLGLRPCVLTGWMQGEAREVARLLAGVARDAPRTAAANGFDCYITGGETTVTVRGDGLGGRSQEIACVASECLAGIRGVALLAAGTDGTDGPTNAAGGVATGDTGALAERKGWTVARALAESDSYRFLEAAGALVMTGPTGSNVGDLVIIVRA